MTPTEHATITRDRTSEASTERPSFESTEYVITQVHAQLAVAPGTGADYERAEALLLVAQTYGNRAETRLSAAHGALARATLAAG